MKPIIALLYDFDRTLCTTDMQNYSFIPNMGMEVDAFWAEVNAFGAAACMDPILAYQYMMIRKSGENRRSVHREDFVALGRDIAFFPGILGTSESLGWFTRMDAYAESLGAVCEHYIISSGLREIIEGTEIGGMFKEIYASEYYYDENGVACW